ncbi:hypothetical protein [Paenibacillus sp. Marseille-Q9583]
MVEWRMARGGAAECNVMLDVLECGFDPEKPYTALSVHDLTVAGLRIQVKRGENNGTNVKADIRRPSAKARHYTSDEIDVFAIVDPVSRRVAYLHMTELTFSRRLTLFLIRDHSRAGLPSAYQAQYFEDYTDFRRVLEVAQNAHATAA